MDILHHQQNSGTQWKIQNQVRCFQINLQHSRSATYNMMKIIEKEEPDLIVVQESYENQNRLVGIEKK
jgi:endonuclease/exonuclease/phosphatase (EEP) superfamily protein YafD